MTDPFSWLTARCASLTQDDVNKIGAHLQAHSATMQHDAPASSYATELERLAYCIGHFGVGAATVQHALESLQWRSRPFPPGYSLFSRDGTLNIVSLGCGPGSDIVGVLRSLYAIPRRLRIYGADREPGWKTWAEIAIKSAAEEDPVLKAAAQPFCFQRLDLNDIEATKRWLEQFRDAGPSIFIVHRVVAALDEPSKLMALLASDILPHEAVLLFVQPVKYGALISELASKLRSTRAAWTRDSQDESSPHHGWTIPQQLWALPHKPETSARYSFVLAVLDFTTKEFIRAALTLLELRGVTVSLKERQRMNSNQDRELARRRLEKAIHAKTVAEVIGD